MALPKPQFTYSLSPLPDLGQEIELVISSLLTDEEFKMLHKMFLDGSLEDFSHRLFRKNGRQSTEIQISFRQDNFEFVMQNLDIIVQKYRFS